MVLVTHSADRFPFIEAVAPDMLKLEEMDEVLQKSRTANMLSVACEECEVLRVELEEQALQAEVHKGI